MITEMKDKIMQFEFEHEENKNQIFDMCPWSIQGHCLSIQRWDRSVGLTTVDFEKIQL